MLTELRIQDFAVIERLDIRPGSGLNVLTGETGAGKSIIVDALSLLLGERASTISVRAGSGRAVVEGVFDASSVPAVRGLLDERGIELEDGLVILRREVAAEGRSRAWVNGSASTASFVGEVGRWLIDLHGQHDHQSLLLPGEQRAILDEFAAAAELAERTRATYERASAARSGLDRLEARQREVAQRAQGLRLQVGEIESARLRAGEEAELESEARRLAHAGELARLATTMHEILYAAEDAVATRLDEVRRHLASLLRMDDALRDWRGPLDDAFHALQELGRQLGEYASRIEDDPARHEEVRRRLDGLFRLKAKYGPTVEDVIETGRQAADELARLDDVASGRRSLEQELRLALAEHGASCAGLSERRTAAARRLDREMNRALKELGLDGARFETELAPLDEAGPHGAEAVEFRVTVNAGFEPGPISRIASGGELSRIMLALKASLAREDRVPALVFDEIDSGIGGRAAHRVGSRLRQVAAHHQVFVVTHLAQIASRADHHFLVDKAETGGRAATRVVELEGEARVKEVARLLGGDPESPTSQAHARELLGSAAG